MKKLMTHEQKRLRERAALTLSLSPDTKMEVTKKEVADFTKDLLDTMARKRQIKNWLVVLIETDGEKP
jgi:hypothetical protein